MITVYSKPNCSYCTRAKTLLRGQNIDYNEVMLGVDIPLESAKELFPEARTAPIIVVEGVYIGGYDQLVKYLAESTNEDGTLICG